MGDGKNRCTRRIAHTVEGAHTPLLFTIIVAIYFIRSHAVYYYVGMCYTEWTYMNSVTCFFFRRRNRWGEWMTRRLTRESRDTTEADDRRRRLHEERGATDFVSRFRDWRNEVLSRDNGPADEVCPARLWVIIADVTFWNWKETSAPAYIIAAVTFRTGPFFFCAAANPIPFSGGGKKTLSDRHVADVRAAYRSLEERACVYPVFFFTPPSSYVILLCWA